VRGGRDVGTYVLVRVIADETDEAAMAKWVPCKSDTDVKALSWMFDQAGADTTASDTRLPPYPSVVLFQARLSNFAAMRPAQPAPG
jgi:alkanesulfonate monooxygenase SsuD/methylene tetrahydromethanopterin reductase-like flavin-dependent oxidoreductase (luciferase family)